MIDKIKELREQYGMEIETLRNRIKFLEKYNKNLKDLFLNQGGNDNE
jgi:hypothetical protein